MLMQFVKVALSLFGIESDDIGDDDTDFSRAEDALSSGVELDTDGDGAADAVWNRPGRFS